MRLLAVIVLLMLISPGKSQDYLWPTDASRYLTSAFCEFRPRHFHAAIDIKTWGQSGYKIFAVADGYIYRIRVSSAGYGKAIYLKLKDGNFAIYAHLMGFTPELERFTDSLRFARRTNILDVQLRPNQFPVKKGQHIGYTGETGIGVPHLHFEMRDARNRPINPLRYYRNMVTDAIPPTVTALAVIPWNGASFVNFRPEIFMQSVVGKGNLKLTEPIYVTGTVALAVKAFDRANGVNNRFGIYSAALEINGTPIFHVQYDRFDYRRTHLVELDKNFTLWRRGNGKFQNLFRHPLNNLDAYRQNPPGSGLLTSRDLQPGPNTFRITLKDYHGNQTTLSGTLVWVEPRGIQATVNSADSNGVLLSVKTPFSLRSLQIYSGKQPTFTQEKALPYELVNITQTVRSVNYDVFLPIRANPHIPFLSLFPLFQTGAPGFPFRLPDNSADSGAFHLRTIHGSMVYEGPPDLLLSLPEDIRQKYVRVIPTSPNQVLASFNSEIFTEISHTPVQFEHLLLSEMNRWHLQIPGSRGTVYSPDSLLKLTFQPNSIYDSMLVSITTLDTSELPAALKPAHYPIKSQVYDLQPFDQPFNSGVWIHFRLPDSLKHQPGVNFYYLDLKKGWSFFPSKAKNGWLTGKITSLEKFAVIQDTIPPVVEAIPPGTKNYRIPPGYRAFHVEDEMAGIYRETQISVEVNGRWMIFEYDPEEKLILVPKKYLPASGGTIRITVADNAGNSLVKTFPF